MQFLGRNYMSIFVSNFNKFLTTMQIKQNYISRKSGIEENKLSRILNQKQVASEENLEALSKAVGKNIQYFLNPNFNLKTDYSATNRIVFYAGNPTEKQNEVANTLLELMENVDVVLSARDSFLNMEN